MFDLVAKYKKWIMIGLFVLIIPPFALFGIDTYFRGEGRAQSAATVGDYQISEQEFAQALRARQEQLREATRGQIDAALLDSNEQRAAVLENLVRQRVLLSHAVKTGLTVSIEQLRSYISEVPEFQEGGQFSMDKYQQFLRVRNTTAAAFENDLRRNILLSQMSGTYLQTSFVPRSVAERVLRIAEQGREVSRALLPADKFIAAVKLEDDAVRKYYEAQQEEFRIPEQARIEYVTLSAESLIQSMQVDAAEVKKYYEQNQRQFGVPESRQAAHILIAVDPSGGESAKAKARALAEQISADLKKDPSRFAELAKKHSQDPGSAAKGGDLGSFARGSMVKAFDEAVFSMKPGEISAPVESEYGFHIIRLTAINPSQIRSFNEARPDIERELKKQQVARAYAELAEKANTVAFEQSDTLKPVADLLKQAPQRSGWITRNGAEDTRLNSPKLLQAVFSEDVLVNKRNTEAVEVAPGVIVVARVVEHKPAAVQPFEQVQAAIEKKLVRTRADQLAAQEGRAQLEALRQGKDAPVQWSAPEVISRANPKEMPGPALREIFKTDASKLPAYAGVEAPGGGYILLRISKVVEPSAIDKAQQNSLADGLARMLGEEQFSAYLESLKGQMTVRINKDAIEKRQ